MNPFLLAFSFIRVPQLFFSLLLWPLLLGLGISLFQVVLSVGYLKLITTTPDQKNQELLQEGADVKWLRGSLFGEELPDEPRICLWSDAGSGEESNCSLKPLDVVIQTADPKALKIENYLEYFRKATPRIHICKTCESDIVLKVQEETTSTNLFSLSAVGVLALKDEESSRLAGKSIVDFLEKKERASHLEGTVFLHPPGFYGAVNLSETPRTMVLVFNAASLVLISLWLALKAHRRVLDYFAKNNALLPLVAACGKENFYISLWLITILRVTLFLAACVPLSIIMFTKALRADIISDFFRSTPDLLTWLITIGASLAAITIIASIGELKQRRPLDAFIFKYLPLGLCIFGTSVWFISIFIPGTIFSTIQTFIACLPIVGVSPIILNPIFTVRQEVLALHAFLSSLLVLWALRSNTRWFAAHLEEL